ncbi:SMI1/KNR4 family protein [Bacillus bingmayongensis]|uniref:SMI1/KNR4 family protein n=1 Tax=Bacillus bingmayongensis TaxID=1150157 RepID=UPI001C8EC903|nr:SMI1/KNR4 family protein [Bacillus bingmayongensis]MBY0595221.1 SMI1/KNR4 family protein [Bacillus bingmayongensis]
MKKLKIKLDEIIDFDMKKEHQIWGKESITKIEEKYSLSLPEDYIFYLRYYGNDYIKDNYRFKPTISLPKILDSPPLN